MISTIDITSWCISKHKYNDTIHTSSIKYTRNKHDSVYLKTKIYIKIKDLHSVLYILGDAVAQLGEALREFDSRWGY
jgi:hypothetical protein